MQFKKIYVGYFFALLLMVGCEEFEDPNLDFSSSLPQYVEFSSGSTIESAPGAMEEVTVRMREARAENVTINYELTGDLSETGSVVIDATNLSNSITVNIPAEVATGSATIRITGVDGGLSIGRGGADAGLSPVSRNITWQ